MSQKKTARSTRSLLTKLQQLRAVIEALDDAVEDRLDRHVEAISATAEAINPDFTHSGAKPVNGAAVQPN